MGEYTGGSKQTQLFEEIRHKKQDKQTKMQAEGRVEGGFDSIQDGKKLAQAVEI